MNQRRGVNDFHHGAQFHRAPAFIIEKLRGKKKHRRADALAAASSQVFADLGDGGDARNRVAAELALNGGKVVAQKLKNFSPVDRDTVGDCSCHQIKTSLTTETLRHGGISNLYQRLDTSL